MRKAKISINEEKSVKLFAERKLKDLEVKLDDQEKEFAKVRFTIIRIVMVGLVMLGVCHCKVRGFHYNIQFTL